jgi:hypothetical protein
VATPLSLTGPGDASSFAPPSRPFALSWVKRSEVKWHGGVIIYSTTTPIPTTTQHLNDNMAGKEIPIPRDPTEDEALALFKAVEEKFPSESLGDDKWYILTVG